jgi:hypothetical protein
MSLSSLYSGALMLPITRNTFLCLVVLGGKEAIQRENEKEDMAKSERVEGYIIMFLVLPFCL